MTMKFFAAVGIPVAPYAGGFLDWPDWLVSDLAIIAGAETAIRMEREKDNGKRP